MENTKENEMIKSLLEAIYADDISTADSLMRKILKQKTSKEDTTGEN